MAACYDAIGRRDYPVILGLMMLTGFAVMIVNLLTDFIYVFVDPRVKLTRRRWYDWRRNC